MSVVDNLGLLKLGLTWLCGFYILVARFSNGFLISFMFFGDSLDRCTLFDIGICLVDSRDGSGCSVSLTRRVLPVLIGYIL